MAFIRDCCLFVLAGFVLLALLLCCLLLLPLAVLDEIGRQLFRD